MRPKIKEHKENECVRVCVFVYQEHKLCTEIA